MKPRAKTILKKTLLGVAGTLAALSAGVAVLTAVRLDRKLDAPYPAVQASRDPAVIERGRYLVRGAAHCADCHGAPDQRAALEAGQDVPLSGGFEFHLPVGTFRELMVQASPNDWNRDWNPADTTTSPSPSPVTSPSAARAPPRNPGSSIPK